MVIFTVDVQNSMIPASLNSFLIRKGEQRDSHPIAERTEFEYARGT